MELNLQFFGGRGASSAGAAGGNGTGGVLTLPDGSKIEYDGDLKFGSKDATLSSAARKEIETWEEKRVKMKVEYAYAVDGDGNPVGKEIRGGKGSVSTPYSYHEAENGVFTHIHPRGDGMLGGTFSDGDLTNFANGKARTTRAAAKEGTYSISKKDDFQSLAFKQFVYKSNAVFDDYKSKEKGLRSEYRSGKIDYNSYLKQNAKAFNTALVAYHNELLANQSKYGYTYTLEKR